MRKKIVLVGRDAAPSGCFKRLVPILKERGFDVDIIVGEGKPLTIPPEDIVHAVSHASIAVLGMSSSPELSQPEITAGNAAKSVGVKYGFYGDVPRCWARARTGAWFEELSSQTFFYFGITQADADAAREVFPNAQLIGTGNPLREEMAFPRFAREEVRAKLDVAPDETLVLAPGGKFAAGNMASWSILMDALSLLARSNTNFRLILATHPGDRTPNAIDATTQKEMKLYEELLSFSPIPARIVDKSILTTSDIVPGADIIVEFGSSIGIEGAYQSVPVVSLGFETMFRRMERISGTRTPEAVRDELSELVSTDSGALAEAIRRLLTTEGFERMHARQQELCPKPTKRGAALQAIADAITRIA